MFISKNARKSKRKWVNMRQARVWAAAIAIWRTKRGTIRIWVFANLLIITWIYGHPFSSEIHLLPASTPSSQGKCPAPTPRLCTHTRRCRPRRPSRRCTRSTNTRHHSQWSLPQPRRSTSARHVSALSPPAATLHATPGFTLAREITSAPFLDVRLGAQGRTIYNSSEFYGDYLESTIRCHF